MHPSDPGSERPRSTPKPDTAIDAVPKEGDDAAEQDANVTSDRAVEGGPDRKSPLQINEIERLESDVAGG
jgi:hypothetical protein